MSCSSRRSRSSSRLKYIGSSENVEGLMSFNDDLSTKVVEHCNESQQLMMLNHFLKESSEYQFQQCIQERMSAISSWKWVLEDLSSRLGDAIKSLKYEHNALRVIVERVKKEIDEHCREGSRPGALSPLTDAVEYAVMEEYKFLCQQKKKFERMIEDLDKNTSSLEKTKSKIESDVINKTEALLTEERCSAIDVTSLSNTARRRKKTRAAPPQEWERHCISLKTAGLRALANAVIIRQKIRGERVHLSIAAQSYAARVDALLRKRLHANQAQMDEIRWQREEAVRDLLSLEDEQRSTEECLMVNMDQIRLLEARIEERYRKPFKEVVKDKLDLSLKVELARLRQFSKVLTENLDKIGELQKNLQATIARFDCTAMDLSQVITLDSERVTARQSSERGPEDEAARGDQVVPQNSLMLLCDALEMGGFFRQLTGETQAASTNYPEVVHTVKPQTSSSEVPWPATSSLQTIMEENEDGDYDSVDDYPVNF